MSKTPVTTRNNSEKSRVEAVLPSGEVAGFAQYDVKDDAFRFFHTEVGDEYGGQGIGGQLAAGVMDFVRGEDSRIIATCSFIRSYMTKHEETHDLLADGAQL